jgi:outer membrane lipoprotein-sorting protein
MRDMIQQPMLRRSGARFCALRPTIRCAAVLAFFAFATRCAADTTQPTTDPATAQTLDALYQRGQTLKAFTADVRMALIDPNLGTASTYSGKVFLQQLGQGDTRFRAAFAQREEDGTIYPDRLEYVFADGKLLDRNYHSKVEHTYQVARPGQKINLLKLGEGPFPLPIGQKPQDVYANFTVQHIPAAKDDPPGSTTHLQLTPRPGTSLAKHFKSIDIWADHANDMPVRIETMDVNQTEDRKTDFANLKINPPLTDADLAPSKLDNHDWQVTPIEALDD